MRILNRGRRPTVALDVGTATICGCSASPLGSVIFGAREILRGGLLPTAA